MDVRSLVEAELDRRGLTYSIEEETGRFLLSLGGGTLKVNIERLILEKADSDDVRAYFDTVFQAFAERDADTLPENIYLELISSSMFAEGIIRGSLSDQADWILAHWPLGANTWRWLTENDSKKLGTTPEGLLDLARSNMERALAEAELELLDDTPFKLAYLESSLPFKASLMLTQGLREKAEAHLGWPLLGVAPCRDFLFLMGESDMDRVGQLGNIVVREFNNSSYPVSMEVFLIDDEGVKAIGAFAKPE